MFILYAIQKVFVEKDAIPFIYKLNCNKLNLFNISKCKYNLIKLINLFLLDYKWQNYL